MPHFFISPENITGDHFILAGPELHYLIHVRRYAPGSVIRLFDGTGALYRARIDAVNPDEISGTILQCEEIPSVKLKVFLYQSIPKGERFDWLIEKSAELGVHTIIPMVTGRSVVKEVSEAKQERWQRLSLAACQQCRRADLMEVKRPVAFTEAIRQVEGTGMNIIPWEGAETKTIPAVYATQSSCGQANVFIGPEGGFSIPEIDAATRQGIVPVTMGPRILRVETAGLLASFILLFLAGEFGEPVSR